MILKVRKFLIAMTGWALLADICPAQITNCCPPVPQTRLEAFETNTGAIIIKGTSPVGTVTANTAVLSVRCTQMTDGSNGRSEYGLAIGITETGQPEDTMLIDYDEIDPLLNALDYLNKVDWSVTPLSGFDAVYTTKGGFRMAAFSSRRNGTIEFSVRAVRAGRPRVLLFRDQVAQLRQVIEQAKTKLDALRK